MRETRGEERKEGRGKEKGERVNMGPGGFMTAVDYSIPLLTTVTRLLTAASPLLSTASLLFSTVDYSILAVDCSMPPVEYSIPAGGWLLTTVVLLLTIW